MHRPIWAFLAVVTLAGTSAAAARADQISDRVIFTLDDITAAFENGKSSPQYAYIENLNDGCGFTAGWIGFCTQTGDMLALVKQYNQVSPGNVLAKYTDTLQQLADSGSDDTSQLGSAFMSDWKSAARDSTFVQLQLQVGHDQYLTPAENMAAQQGVQSNLGLENFFDTALMMGPGQSDCDGLPKIISETNAAVGGSPASGIDEATYFKTFNQIRIQHMQNPCTPGRQNDWPSATDRAQALQQLADQGNWALTTPFTLGSDIGVTINSPHD